MTNSKYDVRVRIRDFQPAKIANVNRLLKDYKEPYMLIPGFL